MQLGAERDDHRVNPFNPRNIVAGSNDYRVFNAREQRNDSTGSR